MTTTLATLARQAADPSAPPLDAEDVREAVDIEAEELPEILRALEVISDILFRGHVADARRLADVVARVYGQPGRYFAAVNSHADEVDPN